MARVTVQRAGAAPERPPRVGGLVAVVDLSEEHVAVIDDEFVVEWQISDAGARARADAPVATSPA